MNNEEDEFKRIEAEALRLNQSKEPTMTTLRQAAQQALEALENLQGGCTDSDDGTVDALTVWCPEVITALRKALEQEQPEQEPTPWRDMVVVTLMREGINKHRARELADHFAAQPESCQTCVEIHSLLDADESMIIRNARDGYPEGRTPRELTLLERVKSLCTYAADWKRWCIEAQTPPAALRPWQGLTEFQFAEIYNKWNDTNGSTPWGLNQALEAKLRKLNK